MAKARGSPACHLLALVLLAAGSSLLASPGLAAAHEAAPVPGGIPDPDKARKGTRTPDPLLTMEVLYQLSYPGSEPAG